MQIVKLLQDETVLAGDVKLPKEGSLLPETYKVERGMTRAALIAKMQAAQKTRSTNYGRNGRKNCRLRPSARRLFWPRLLSAKPASLPSVRWLQRFLSIA